MASITAIESMEHRDATKLRKAGIRTTEALLKSAATRTGRRRLSRETGLPEADILAWANRADVMRIRGIGSEYADLLEATGVDTIRALRRRNPDRLLEAMTETNLRRRVIRRLPTDGMVRRWVDEAQETEPLVAR
jgi:predicted flap endonuclease-1-like 5' DNA nuclease